MATTISSANGNAAAAASVLLVEDQEDHAELITRAFRREPGWSPLVVVATVAAARAAQRVQHFDLVLVDFLLPDGRGVELLPGSLDARTCPCIIMTSHGDEQLAVDAMKAGAMDYIVKSNEMFRALPRMCERVLREWRMSFEREQKDRELRLYEHMVSATSDLLVYIDSHRVVRSVNQHYLDAMGLSRDEVIGHASEKVLGAELHARVRPHVDRALAGERHVRQVWREYPGLGWRFMDIEYSPYIGADAKVEGVVMRGRDITGMREAVDALQVSEGRLRTIIDSAPECIMNLDANGVIVDINPAGLKMLAVTNPAEVGKGLFCEMLDPADEAAFRTLHSTVMAGGSGELEYQFIDARGRRLWLQTNASPLRNNAGEVVAMLAMTRDFTARRGVEQRLRTSEARFRELFESVPVGVCQVTVDGTVKVANPALREMFGFDAAVEFDGSDQVLDYYVGPLGLKQLIARIQKDNSLEAMECQLRRVDGTVFEALLNARAGRDSQGNCERYEVTVTDITELARARLAIESEALRSIASGGAVDVTLERVCRNFVGLEPGSACCVLATSGDAPGLRVAPQLSAGALDLLERQSREAGETGATARNQPGPARIRVRDLSHEAAWKAVGRWRNCWEIPLQAADGAALGVVTVLRTATGAPTADQRRMLMSIAHVCGIALEQDRNRRQQRALMTVLEATPDIVAMLDTHGKPFYMNHAGLSQLGFAAEELGTLRLDDLHPPAVADHVRTHGLREAAKHGTWREETLFTRRDGSNFVTSQVIVAHYAQDTSLAYFSMIARDLSQRLEAEKALRVSEARNRALVDSAPEAILVCEVENGRFVDLNSNACRLTGLDRERLLSIGLEQISVVAQPGGLDAAEQIANSIERTLAGEEPVFDWMVLAADGRHVPCEVRLATLPSPQRRLIRASIVDVSQRKRAERALRESELRFQGIFNQTSGFIAVLAKDGTTVDVNDPALKATGLHRRDIVGHAFATLDWWPHGETQTILRRCIAIANEGRPAPFELEFIDATGSKRAATGAISPILSHTGQVSMLIAEAVDVTARVRAERRLTDYAAQLQGLSKQLLQTQENERRHIARELHDEIGQALTALKINLHTAKSGFGARIDAESELFADSLEITENVLRQVRDLSLDLRPSMLDDLGLAAALRWYTGKQSKRTGIPIDLRMPADLPRLSGEAETACFRIVQEAITNTVKHAQAHSVTVDVGVSHGMLSVEIADDGAGFDLAGLQARVKDGLSSGLFGMEERVQLVGGRMRIESRPDEGTRLNVSFPYRTDVDAMDSAEGAA